MEEDVGSGSRLGGSKMPLSSELPTELLSESMGGEVQVEGSYEDVDEGEIMVEVVGSDVFVNGVSGQNGDLEGHEWENREENMSQKTSEAMEWNEGDVLDEEVWNPEISGMVVASSTTIEPVVVKCEAVDVATVVEENDQISEKEEILADLAQLCGDSMIFHEAINASDGALIVPSELPLDPNAEDQDNVQFGGIDVAVGEVVIVIATEEGEVSATDSRKDRTFKVKAERTSTDTDYDMDTKIVDESRHSIVKMDAIVSNVQESTSETNLSNEESIKLGSLFRMYCPSNPTNEGHFAQSDLVWGKVQNHPWWPGQIFDQADASEKAIKYHRKGSHLVAYFGERTFAWNDASYLKPFMPYFSQIEKQSNSEAFQSAVNSALEEVSRRVEFGLTCPCVPKDSYIKVGTQVIENSGIREESSRRCSMDNSSRANSFEPDKLLDYIHNLALCASSSTNRLDLVIAKAQLSAFCRFKGYRSLTSTDLIDNNLNTNVEDDLRKSISPRKRKTLDPLPNGSDKKISQLLLTQDSKRRQDIENSAHTFSWDDRNSNVWNKQDRKRKAETVGFGEGFEFDNAIDSYWKDRIVQNHSGEQPSIIQDYSAEQLRHDWQNRTANPQPTSSVKTWHTSHSRKRPGPDDKQKQESSPAELLLNFAERKHVPSEINLNKMFRRFGSLMESETEVDRDSGRAKVIFKRGSDAEVARNSAEKFNIFGPVVVKYEIGYSPLISVKISSIAPQFSEGDHNVDSILQNGSQNRMVEEGNLDNFRN